MSDVDEAVTSADRSPSTRPVATPNTAQPTGTDTDTATFKINGRRSRAARTNSRTHDRTASDTPRLTRRGRLRKWDRPTPPMDWRWWVGNLGKTLISIGLLMFGFVAYQLWGTGIETARAQTQLESEFDALLAGAPNAADFGSRSETIGDPAIADEPPAATDEPTPIEPTADPARDPAESAAPVQAVPVEDQNLPLIENGDAIARIEIPAIGVSDIVVAGVETRDLKKGPGHFPDTPLPGQLGNAAIAGHRTTYGQPFHDVDKLAVGDDIVVTTLSGEYTYRVTGQQIVSPSDYQVVATTDASRATLTLTSCHPKWTAKQRIVIFSELVSETSAPVGEPVLNYGRPAVAPSTAPTDPDAQLDDPIAGADDGSGDPTAGGGVTGSLTESGVGDVLGADDLGTAAVNDEIADAFSDGWFSDPAANGQVGLWGLLLAAIGIGAYLVSRKLRRDWMGALVGIMPFVVTMYFFFQNVNRLLPPNL